MVKVPPQLGRTFLVAKCPRLCRIGGDIRKHLKSGNFTAPLPLQAFGHAIRTNQAANLSLQLALNWMFVCLA